jgi:CYTH domain-containing protein
MALEIERRFLVAGDGWRPHVRWSQHLCQGYLAASAEALTLRVRTAGADQAWLTLKLPAGGIARHEFEYSIPLADAQALLLHSGEQLAKQRHGLDLPGGDWVLDVFEGANAPLVIAEVELATADQSVAVPSWCVQELTGLGGFSNAALARRPFASWPPQDREPWLQRLCCVSD